MRKSSSFSETVTGVTGIVVIMALFFGPGWLIDVVFGKMTTGQYVQKVHREITTEWPMKFRDMTRRISDLGITNRVRSQSDTEHSGKDKQLTLGEKIRVEARKKISLPPPVFTPKVRTEEGFENSPFYFATDFIDTLALTWESESQRELLEQMSDQEVNQKGDRILLNRIRLTEQAIHDLTPYLSSENEMIRETAEHTISIFSVQKQLIVDAIAIRHHIGQMHVSNEEEATEGIKILNELQFELNKMVQEFENTYRMLVQAAILLTHTMVSNKTNEEGKPDRLAITKEERYKLIEQMNNSFEHIPTFKGEIEWYKAPVAAIYDWLSSSGHKPIDG